MQLNDFRAAKAYFDEGFEVSVGKLLALLRSSFEMDLAFIGKFEEGYRTSLIVDSENADACSEDLCFSHPIEETYCHRIATGELPAIIPNTLTNSITKDMPVTQELSIGAYAGVPITLSNGEIYGTLCCIKHTSDSALAYRDASLLRFVADVIADRVESYRDNQNRFAAIRKKIQEFTASDQLRIVFQPIWSIHENRIRGYEALSRFDTDPYYPPDVWFSEAAEVGLQEYLELLAFEKALGHLDRIPDDCFLSINASPELILSGAVSRQLMKHSSHRVIVEVTEHSRIKDYQEFKDAIHLIRRQGAKFAIDDAGAGYASFQAILELDVDVIKLDLSLIRNIHLDIKKQALASALVSYAKYIRAVVVGEGVEYAEEFELLKGLGVDKIQGYYVGKPGPLSYA